MYVCYRGQHKRAEILLFSATPEEDSSQDQSHAQGGLDAQWSRMSRSSTA